MGKVIIINGASCSGKSSISKAICTQTENKYLHLQIDKSSEFYSTIFPPKYKFVENAPGTDDQDNGLKGLFNNNRLARRKIVAAIMLSTAKELLSRGLNIVIDTALDGPDAKELAKQYYDYLEGNDIKFIGIYCPLEKRKEFLKKRTDNLFLTEEFLEIQENQHNAFEFVKELYDIVFDSSKESPEEIAKKILEYKK